MPTATENPTPNRGPAPQHTASEKQPRTNGSAAIAYFQMHLATMEGLVSALHLISGQAVETLGQEESQVGGALKAIVSCIAIKAAMLLDDADHMLGDPAWDPSAASAAVQS